MRQRKGVSELDSSLGLGLNFSSIMFWNLEIIPICFPSSFKYFDVRIQIIIDDQDHRLTLSPSTMWICSKMHNFRDNLSVVCFYSKLNFIN